MVFGIEKDGGGQCHSNRPTSYDTDQVNSIQGYSTLNLQLYIHYHIALRAAEVVFFRLFR